MGQRAQQHGSGRRTGLVLALAILAGCAESSRVVEVDASTPSEPERDGGSVSRDAAAPLDAFVSLPDAHTDAAERARLEGLVGEVAAAICGALARCCDVESRARFFGPMAANERVPGELRDAISDGVTDAECADVVGRVYDVMPLGPWARAALDGYVRFDAAGADACLATLETAACGEPVGRALFDGECFGFGAPIGGASQRRAFTREARDGSACIGLTDGFGGAFFGTCDPDEASCCVMTEDRCSPAGDRVGTCRTAARVGEPCNPITGRICVTGLECDDEGRCVEPSTTELALGATCAEGFDLLGDCVDGWCDLFGSKQCEPFVENGGACESPEECRSGRCESSVCVAETFCAAR